MNGLSVEGLEDIEEMSLTSPQIEYNVAMAMAKEEEEKAKGKEASEIVSKKNIEEREVKKTENGPVKSKARRKLREAESETLRPVLDCWSKKEKSIFRYLQSRLS